MSKGDSMLTKFADGLDAATDGRGWGSEHQKVRDYIVCAVDSHDALVEAVKIALFWFEGQSKQGNFYDVPAGFNHDISMEGLLSKALTKAENVSCKK